VSHWATEFAARITDNMAQGVLVTDGSLIVMHANAQAARLLGAPSASDLAGLCLGDGEADNTVVFEPALTKDGAAQSGRYAIKTPFHRDAEVDITVVDNRTSPPSYLLFMGDTSGAGHGDKHFFQTEKLAAMDNIVAGVAHELNNPMTAILGYAELLLATETEPKRKQRVSLIAEEADRCAKIIANMLSFTRSFGKAFEKANVCTLLEEVVSLVVYQMRVDGVSVHIDIERDTPDSSVQPSAMRRLFLNVLRNAHQALLEVPLDRRAFWVSAEHRNGNIAIAIADSGPGIPEDVRYRIFDPFFTTRTLGEGMGLGLSVAYGIVHEHRGRIWMEPRDGGGTVIKMEIPVNPA